MAQLLEGGYLGDVREIHVTALTNSLAEAAAPLSWRQDVALSGFNMLVLGIIHETLLRWLPPPVRVSSQVHAFIPSRIDPESGVRRPVGTPDSCALTFNPDTVSSNLTVPLMSELGAVPITSA